MKKIPISDDAFALVDDKDYPYLIQFRWYIQKQRHRYYARRRKRIDGRTREIRMHRVIAKARPGEEVDHVNGDGLDNRKCNLRIATAAQNQWNRSKQRGKYTSKYKGVSYSVDKNRWSADIYENRIVHRLGKFMNEYDAVMAYNAAAVIWHGEFANLNRWDGPTPHSQAPGGEETGD